MTARIYKPTKTAMQSGKAKTKDWVLDYDPEVPRTVEPLMGWTSSSDMRQQLKKPSPTASVRALPSACCPTRRRRAVRCPTRTTSLSRVAVPGPTRPYRKRVYRFSSPLGRAQVNDFLTGQIPSREKSILCLYRTRIPLK